jgi:luciferase family oxidoreductase group 1
MSVYTLSITDQSPMRRGGTAAEALRETIAASQAAERLGYARYWVAEHHNTGTHAGSSPEILIGQILANTQRIRVGSGGVMLSHYAPLKVAEQFRMLNAFYPGRVDLGIGRAPGSDQLTAAALSSPRPPIDIEHFPQMVADLVGYLHNALQPDHPFAKVKVAPGPQPDTAPEVWLLGSSDYSAQLAAYLGLPFAFADFFGNTGKHGPAVADLYRRNFRPSELCPEPRLNVTVQVVCAPTTEEARFIASSRDYNRARRMLEAQGAAHVEGLVPPEEASGAELNEQARAFADQFVAGFHTGDPATVKAELVETAERYGTTDIGIVTITYRLEDRIRSLELLAKAFGLEGAA